MSDFIVTGFYTPNYAPLAAKFSANLDDVGVPHHLYAVDKRPSWHSAILLKPTIVDRAMRDFPDMTIILMDIDCELAATVAPVALSSSDVSLYVGVSFLPTIKRSHQLRVMPSSRVIMWRQTRAARALVANWRKLCVAAEPTAARRGDEELLMQAIAMTEGLNVGIIDRRYAGHDPSEAPDGAVVVHHSAHDASRVMNEQRKYMKNLRRQIVGWIVGKPYKQWKYGESK
jgi:hypothetical protein